LQFITQALDGEGFSASLLGIINREPYPQYVKIFSKPSLLANRGNMTDITSDAYKRLLTKQKIVNGIPIPKGDATAAFVEWRSRKMLERTTSLQLAGTLWAESNSNWHEWLWEIRSQSEILMKNCEQIEPEEEWDHEGNIIGAVDVLEMVKTIDKTWLIFKNSIGGLSNYYLYQIEKLVETAKDMLRFHKMGRSITALCV
jgi:hypothetical protein